MNIYHSGYDIQTLIDTSDVIITGTGWQSKSEQETLRIAKRSGKPCFVLLDHWQSFRARFTEECINDFPPSCLIVTNMYAQHLASSEVPEIPCVQIQDLYLDSIVQEYNQIDSPNSTLELDRVLYLSNGQPYNFDLPFGQLIQIKKLLDLFSVNLDLSRRFDKRVAIRAHPADQNIPLNILESFGLSMELESGALVEQLHRASLVVGADTYALYVAMRIGRPVVTVLSELDKPSWLGFAPSVDELKSNLFLRSIFLSFFNRIIDGFYFRFFSTTDVDDVHLATLNDSEYMRFSSNSSGDVTFIQACDYTTSLRSANGYHLAIVNVWHERIGTCTLRVDEKSRRVEVGILIYKSFSGQGVGLQVWKNLTTQLDMAVPGFTIWAGTIERNKAMSSILKQAGYIQVESRWEDYLSINKLDKVLIYEYPNHRSFP